MFFTSNRTEEGMTQEKILQGYADQIFGQLTELDETAEAAIAEGLTEDRAGDLLRRTEIINRDLRDYLSKLGQTQAAPTGRLQSRPALGLETRA